jgi:hypothetical protein
VCPFKPLKWCVFVQGGEAWVIVVDRGTNIHVVEMSFVFGSYGSGYLKNIRIFRLKRNTFERIQVDYEGNRIRQGNYLGSVL